MLTYEEARQKTNLAIDARQKQANDSVQCIIEEMNDLIISSIDNCESVATKNLPNNLSGLQIASIKNYYLNLKYGAKIFDNVLTVDWYIKNTFDSR
jgi:hypothetical protein